MTIVNSAEKNIKALGSSMKSEGKIAITDLAEKAIFLVFWAYSSLIGQFL